MPKHESPDPAASAALDPEAREANRINHLVGEARTLYARIAADTAQLEEHKAELIKLAAGKYFDFDGNAVTVIGESTAIHPNALAIAAARKVAGALARKLFVRTVTWKTVKEFRTVAPAVLSPKKAEKVIKLCEVPRGAQVKF